MEIDIFIDRITDCLEDSLTGDLLDTEFQLVKKTITPIDAAAYKKEGWNFDWSKPQKDGCEVYQLFIKGDAQVQGMIAFKHIREQCYTYATLVESAPWNIGEKGRYKGVGAHLFAIACKESWDVGNEGYVQFIAKSNLIQHYTETLGAQLIGGQIMFIDSYAALKLIKKYFKEE